MRNVLTFDVEDWYQGLDVAHAAWTEFERRLSVGLEFILERLSGAGVRATFFVLGITAREQPQWVRRIAEQGHEIGTHGWSHTPIYRQSREQFRAELCRSLALLQDLTGRRVCGHRAAFFSITRQTRWALDDLAEHDVQYDSSIFPVYNYRYGMPRGSLPARAAVVAVGVAHCDRAPGRAQRTFRRRILHALLALPLRALGDCAPERSATAGHRVLSPVGV